MITITVVIVGSGELAKHIFPVLISTKHSIVMFTRTPKDWRTSLSPGSPQLITDYSDIAQLTIYLDGHKINVVVSTLAIDNEGSVPVHQSLLTTCQRSKTCNRLMPSEWAANRSDFPDQPIFYLNSREAVRQLLRAQSEIEYTMVLSGWFLEDLLPPGHKARIFKDIGDAFVLDYEKKVMRLYGAGKQEVSLATAGDVGTAVMRLVEAEKWEEYTFMQSEQLSWNELFDEVKARDASWMTCLASLAQSVQKIWEAGKRHDDWDAAIGMLEVHGHVEAPAFPKEDLARQREKYFEGMKRNSVDDVLDKA